MTQSPCPGSGELLHDYFAGLLPREEEDRVEAHVFECDRCGAAYERAGALASALRQCLPPAISRARLEALTDHGFPVRTVRIPPERAVDAEFTTGAPNWLFALAVEPGSAERLDLELIGPNGDPLIEYAAAPFDSTRGELLILCQRHYIDAFGGGEVTYRVYAVEGEVRRPVGDYVVNHVLGP